MRVQEDVEDGRRRVDVRESVGGGRVARGPAFVPEDSFTQSQHSTSLVSVFFWRDMILEKY